MALEMVIRRKGRVRVQIELLGVLCLVVLLVVGIRGDGNAKPKRSLLCRNM